MANLDLLEMLQRVMAEIVDAKSKKLNLDYDDIKNLDTLKDHTTVLEIPNSERLIVQDF